MTHKDCIGERLVRCSKAMSDQVSTLPTSIVAQILANSCILTGNGLCDNSCRTSWALRPLLLTLPQWAFRGQHLDDQIAPRISARLLGRLNERLSDNLLRRWHE
jgi:hypothetical protein